MGTNRSQPFGYRMELGKTVIDPEESRWVVYIYEQYILGESFKAISDKLCCGGIRYDADKPWNKSMIARILGDRRYTGEGKYPQIIDNDTFLQAEQKRSKRKGTHYQTQVQKVLKRKSGGLVTADMEHEVLYLLNMVAGKTDRLKVPDKPAEESGRVATLQTELDQILKKLPVDENMARQRLSETIVAMYEAVDPREYETQRMKRIFEERKTQTELDADVLDQCVATVTMDRQGKVRVRLKNDQILERRERNERIPENRNHHTCQTQNGAGDPAAETAGSGILSRIHRGRRTAVKL